NRLRADIRLSPRAAFREDRQCDLMCRGIALAWSGPAKGRSYSFHLYDQSVKAITDIWAVSLQDRPQPGGEQMTPKPHKANWTRAPQQNDMRGCMIIRSPGR